MNLNDYLIEIKLGDNPELESIFNLALKQVFSENYLNKIESKIKKQIRIKEKHSKNQNEVAWVQGNTIYINPPVFNSKNKKTQIKYLLHEFMHILNNTKSFIVSSQFKEIKQLSKKLWEIIKKHSDNPGLFLTGKEVDDKYLNYQEALSYLMNDKIKWEKISLQGKQLFLEELQKYNIFNLQHEFWKKRLT